MSTRKLSAALTLIALFTVGRNAKSAELSSEGQAWLRTAIGNGSLGDLRWADFSDYREHVKKFYEFNGYSLWWVKGMEPTAQARQAVAVVLQAGQKGLSADDYDGPRWSGRLANLKP